MPQTCIHVSEQAQMADDEEKTKPDEVSSGAVLSEQFDNAQI